MKDLVAYYEKLSEKDRRALRILAIFLVPLTLYFLLLSPGIHYYQQAKSSYINNQTLLAWINENASKVESMNQQATPSRNEPLLQAVSRSAGSNNIKLDRIQPEGDNRVRVWLNNAEFKSAIQWLSALSSSRITISSASIDKTDKTGIVNLQVLLTNTP